MPEDKSLFFYGSPYHLVFDTLNKPHRNRILGLVPKGASVLDIGCGTGELAMLLRRTKGCPVVGVDLSLQMIDFAASRNPYGDVWFLHRDAADIPDFDDDHFDIAILCQVIHELPVNARLAVIREALRLARRTLIADYNSPLPTNLPGVVSRLIEATIGRDHHANFKAYLADGGATGILAEAGLEAAISQRLPFNNGCHQIVVVDRAQ